MIKTSTLLTVLAAGIGGYFAMRALQNYQANKPRLINTSYDNSTGGPGNPYTNTGVIYL